MPNDREKKEEKKNILEAMDDTIKILESRQGRLKFILEQKKGKAMDGKMSDTYRQEIRQIKKSLDDVSQQLSFVKTTRKDFEEELAKEKKKEEKEKLEGIMKFAILIGAIDFQNRMQIEADKKLENEVMEQMIFNSPEEELNYRVEEVFANNTFNHVSKDDIDKIMNNEEFKEMAENDPNKIDREEDEARVEYEKMMLRNLKNAGIEVSEDFEENEANYKKSLTRMNEYEKAIKPLTDFINNEVEEFGDPEDKKILNTFLQRVNSLAQETRRIQDEYISGEGDFENGNGYTKDLIEKETKIRDDFKKYTNDLVKRIGDYSDNKAQERADGLIKVYTYALKLAFFLDKQLLDDGVMARNNSISEKKEQWFVYERINPKARQSIVQKRNSKDINKAISKIRRLKIEADGKGNTIVHLNDTLAEETQLLLEKLRDSAPIESKEDKDWVNERFAMLTLNQIIINEANYASGKERPFLSTLDDAEDKKKTFMEMSRKLAKTKAFKKAISGLLKDGSYKEKIIRFLSVDFERNIAKGYNENKNALNEVNAVKLEAPKQKMSRSKTYIKGN
ncbi:hypothetical protein SAMN04487934_103198 [Eubacterium ruminantium]|nr:hypothetical protein SAMN04487934_103198 [Eubacterium ruminantium]